MTATPVPDPPYDTKTDDFGQLLQEEYGSKNHNTSINYFIIMLGKQVSELLEPTSGCLNSEPPAMKKEKFSEILKRIGFPIWNFTEKGWEAKKLLVFKYENRGSNKRDQEEEINLSIREYLKENFKKVLYNSSLPPLPDVGIIFTRACLYKQEPCKIFSTNEVGAVLNSKYKDRAGDTPIDYFYLIIQEESGYKLDDEALEVLQELPEGKWRDMNKENWPGLFIGHYPLEPFMTERRREWTLNTKVREPLIEKLKKIIEDKKGEENFQAKVHIIITRACVYTACEYQQPSVCTGL